MAFGRGFEIFMGQKYKFKTRPYRHQHEALKYLIQRGERGGALLMEPRTGKTKVCIDWASILHQASKCTRVLIICPNSVMEVWIDEIQMHCPFKHRILLWDKKGRKKFELPKYGAGHIDFVIMNFDAFSTPGRSYVNRKGKRVRSRSRGGRYDIKKKIQAWRPHLTIIDESHRIKSPSAKKTTALINWVGPYSDYRVIATGTAVTKANQVHNLWAQFKFLDPKSKLIDGMTFSEFKSEYGRWVDIGNYKKFTGPKNQPKLKKLLHKEAFAVARDECFDLPPAFPPKIIPVPLEESAKLYDEMAESMVAMLESGEITEASIRLVQNLRFSQITSGLAKTEPTPEYPDGRWVRVGKEKLRVLEDLCDDWFEEDEKLVICARFRADIISIREMIDKKREYQKFGVKTFVLMGGMKGEERQAAIKGFRDHVGPAAFIMNPQAGALGIDLRSASTMVWYSLIQSYVDYTQSLDRIALSGKANRFYYLLAEGTYDELQYETLQVDGDIVKAIHESPRRLLRNFKG